MHAIRMVAVLSVGAALATYASAQSLALQADLGGREFFEGQPVYASFRIANLTRDTVFVPMFEVETGDLRLEITRGDATRVDESVRIMEFTPGPTWRGVPVPPSGALYEGTVLQDRFGDPRPRRRWVFRHQLPPGVYRVTARFNVAVRGNTQWLQAEPVEFQVRRRTPAEDALFARVEAIVDYATSKSGGRQYFDALLAWAESQTTTAPDNPYLPYMLHEGTQLARAAGGTTAAGLRRIADLRDRVVTAQGNTPAAAVLMLAIASNTPERLQPLSERLSAGLAKDVATHLIKQSFLRRGGLR